MVTAVAPCPNKMIVTRIAVKRLEANWEAVYSYFQSSDDCPVAKERLMQVDRDGARKNGSLVRCYLRFIENVSKLIHESVLAVEKKESTICIVY